MFYDDFRPKSLEILLFPLRFAAKKEMSVRMKNAYEEFCGIITAEKDPMILRYEIKEFYKCLGGASVAFENLLYGEMGMSCEDMMQMLLRQEYMIYV